MKDWSEISVKYFVIPLTTCICGLMIGFGLNESKKNPSKKYPIEVQCHWSTGMSQGYSIMECDSIKKDTLWKDGNKIVAKNIINVLFK